MKKILLLVIGLGVLGACATAKMAIDPELKNNSHEYKITEKHGLTNDTIRFGPYLASNIDRDWMKGKGFSISSFKSEKRSQIYTYDFMGESSWKATCRMSGESKSLGVVEFDMESALNCGFTSTGEKKTKFSFRLAGLSLVEAEGEFSVGKNDFRVAVVNKIEGSSLSLGYPTGYAFYSGDKLIAGLDAINSYGTVWLNKELSGDVKDRLSLVMVALLVFQEKSLG